MGVSLLNLRHQGPVLASLLKTGYAAYRSRKAGKSGPPPPTPGPVLKRTVPPRPAELVRDYVRRLAESRAEVPELTAREREVLQLLAEGNSTKEIAASLHVSAKTIETHRRRIMDKLGIDNVAGLTKYAIREGLTSL